METPEYTQFFKDQKPVEDRLIWLYLPDTDKWVWRRYVGGFWERSYSDKPMACGPWDLWTYNRNVTEEWVPEPLRLEIQKKWSQGLGPGGKS